MEISSAIEIASVDDRKTEDEIELIDSVGVRTEFERLSQLAIPMVITYTLEIFPDVVSVVLVGHIRSPNTPALVDGAMLSIMVSADHMTYGSNQSPVLTNRSVDRSFCNVDWVWTIVST